MKHATSISLHAYWRSCQGETGVPPGEIRAVELAPILPSLFLIDLDKPSDLPFRFCGASLAIRYGRDMTDESFLTLWSPEDRAALERDARIIATRSAGLVAGVLAETVGSGFTSFEMLLLPLIGENGGAGAIGSMVRIGGHEETNRIRARIVSQSLTSIRFLAAPRPSLRPAAAIASHTAVAGVRRQYRHLTVVTGGK